MEHLTLYELNQYINQVIHMNFEQSVWVSCELGNVNTSGGHIYLELVERDDIQDRQIARIRANIWRSNVSLLKEQHGKELLSELLTAGQEVKLKGTVHFHELYGLSLHVEDIDPEYTLGSLDKKRREIIKRLQKEELLEKNSRYQLPPVLQRIAVISSKSAAGWSDFREHLEANAFGHRFYPQLHTAKMQGDRTEIDVVRQLESIASDPDRYDCIVIIRGGGSSLDLSSFDSYAIGKAIAHSPLPVLTGIGHEIDETVPDLVAHTSLKTPTAVAHFLLEHNLQFEQKLLEFLDEIFHVLQMRSGESMRYLSSLTDQLLHAHHSHLQRTRQHLDYAVSKIIDATQYARKDKHNQLERLSDQIDDLRPDHILARGYTVTEHDGHRLTGVVSLESGMGVTTYLEDGSFASTINKIEKDE